MMQELKESEDAYRQMNSMNCATRCATAFSTIPIERLVYVRWQKLRAALKGAHVSLLVPDSPPL